ncbi:MAG: VOC family protein [Chloroflexi bacterium]|nr:VOC family protein [Chloroflexota bacterium]
MNDGAPQITPFLWLDGCAREAADFYVSVFRDSRIIDDTALPDGPGAGSHIVSFVVKGQRFTAFDGIPAYEFTPAISFVVDCESQEEIDAYWDRLAEDGSPIQCGWIQDKFGVHWQIVPADLSELMKEGPRADAVITELLTMVKIDLERLRTAYANA